MIYKEVDIARQVAVRKNKGNEWRGKKKEVVKLETLKRLNLNAAGLDIGGEEIWVCVPEGRDETTVRMFETFTIDLNNLADWLESCGIETVAMESTGVYWIPIYEILEQRGLEVYLVNAKTVKNVSGRKTDIEDCQWIQQLHTYGLLQASFRPEEEIVALRNYSRHRKELVKHRGSHIQHMQKALEQMNIKLTLVVKDITGLTGLSIIRAITQGETDAIKLARFRDPHCKNSEETIAKALEGHYRPELIFVLKQALELYDYYTTKIVACDKEMERYYEHLNGQRLEELDPVPPSKKKERKKADSANFDLRASLYHLCGVDLTAIDGLNSLSVQSIIAEVGIDMSKWPTFKHFASWLGLSPNNRISGGKVLKRNTKKNKNPANTAFRMAAMSVNRSNSALGAFYRRKKAQLGPSKANVATAHKIARIFYQMLRYRQPYQDLGAEYYQQQHTQRTITNLKRKAKKLGFVLVEA